jgi:DNA (cytosine-5)-methyltransferase 1
MLTHASLFSGIGGFDLAAEWAGWENIFHCEWNPFGQKVLAHHFPNSKSYNDITKTNFSIHAGTVDVLTGGFPCQPYSQAGKRLGKEDERHLWPEMLRAIREVKPSWVVGENVLGIVNWNGGMVFEEVQLELEAEGYEVQTYILPAASVGAPHQRYRTWFVAYSQCNENRHSNNRSSEQKERILRGGKESNVFNARYSNDVAYSDNKGCERNREQPIAERKITSSSGFRRWDNFPTEPSLCRRDDGISKRLDGITFPKWRNESIKGYGNAIVPQVAYEIFKAINEFELLINK